MEDDKIQYLIDRYVNVSQSVTRKLDYLIKDQLCTTSDQHWVLKFINQKGKCTSSELAEAFNVNKSAVTAIITRLTDKDLIERTRDKDDRRVVYLTLSNSGKELYDETEQRVCKLVESFISKFDDEEIHSFLATYEKLEKILIDLKEEIQED